MMIDILLAATLAFVVLSYWLLCQRRAAEVQVMVVSKLEAHYAAPSVSDDEKRIAHTMYHEAQHWYFMPMVSAWAPVHMLTSLIRQRESRKVSEKQREVVSAILLMYFAKNPITAVTSICFLVLVTLIGLFFGVLLNRIRSMSSIGDAFQESLSNPLRDTDRLAS